VGTRKNAVFSRSLHASRRELFARREPHLKPLPIGSRRSYVLHHRIVDAGGYVNCARQPLSVPLQAHRQAARVRETKERIGSSTARCVVATWERVIGACCVRH